MTTVAAQEDVFEIVVPLPTVVRAPEGSETVLSRTQTPGELIGETCEVSARSENQSSVHPDNDLVVESGSQIVLPDGEADPVGPRSFGLPRTLVGNGVWATIGEKREPPR